MADRDPRLIVIQGGSATGKSTLASELSSTLKADLISKDLFKEAFYDQLGTPATKEESEVYGRAAIAAMYATANSLLGSGRDVILESAFNKRFADQDITNMIRDLSVSVTQVFCVASLAVRIAREAHRHESGERHTGHHYVELHTDEQIANDAETYASLSIEHTIKVNTDNGYSPGIKEIVRYVEQHN